MSLAAALTAVVLASAARASQPGAPAAIPAPLRELQWGQINFLHTTDTHGWHGGHMQEAQYSADWGDYVSFAEHMRKKADEKGVDLLLVDTGDRVEGNGLYDSSDPKGKYTYDIVKQQSIDIICTGNHELYQADTVVREHNITVPNFKDSYIASNLDFVDPGTGERVPQATRYRKLKTKNLGLDVVAFGFLFDFDRNANDSIVQRVEDTIKEEWFQGAIREKPDLFVVIGHVGLRMKEFELIFKAIRDKNWHTPIAFLGGHAHVRDYRKFDDNSYAIASGRYMETIGWFSLDGIKKREPGGVEPQAAVTFNRRYIDNNLFGLYHHSGLNESTFPTEHGQKVTKMITKGRKALKLDKRYGCAPQDYWMTRSAYPSNSSIFSWLENQVLPDVIVREDRKNISRLAIVNTGGVRFDIFKGPFTVDSTFLISPFVSKFNYIPNVPYKVASKVLQVLNSGGKVMQSDKLDTMDLGIPEQRYPSEHLLATWASHEGASQPFAPVGHQKPLGSRGEKLELIEGYTTKDDAGNDGDDTEHSPIDNFNVPNCIQSKIAFPAEGDPETVDLVFIDYVQPYLLFALKYVGGDYSTDDVQLYKKGTLTDFMKSWVSDNWKGKC